MDKSWRTIDLQDLIRLLWIFILLFGTNDCRAVKRRLRQYDPYAQPSAIPEFLQVPNNITVHEGEFAVLKCYIYNLGPKTVVWRRANDEFPLTIGLQVFTPNPRVTIEHVKELRKLRTYWNLQIANVTREDAGTYECQISAKDFYTTNVTLNVLDPIEYSPQLTLKGTEYLSLFEDMHLICNATGGSKAPSEIDWFFKGNPITEADPRVQILKHRPIPGRWFISELVIERVVLADRGDYACRSSDNIIKGMKVHVLNDTKNIKERDFHSSTSGYSAAGSRSDASVPCQWSREQLITASLTLLTFLKLR